MNIIDDENLRACDICGKKARLINKMGKYICKTCYNKNYAPKRECCICHNIGVSEKIVEGKYICRSCYRKEFRPKRVCSICNSEDFCDKKIDGNFICRSCYNKTFRPKIICFICNKEDFSAKIVDGRCICRSCYRKTFQPKRVCSICNKEAIADKIINGKYICHSCYKKISRPKLICSICNKECSSFKVFAGKHVCSSCYQKVSRPKLVCSICNTESYSIKIFDDKNVCPSCYKKVSGTKSICSICNKECSSIIIFDGKNVCASCYKKVSRPKSICSICNKECSSTKLFNDKNVCPSCYKKVSRPKLICLICNKESSSIIIFDGKNVCSSCYKKVSRPKSVCSICNKESSSIKNFNGKNICSSCYKKVSHSKTVCSICSKEGYFNKYKDQYVCSTCYKKYFQPKRVCSLCGNIGTIEKISGSTLICSACYKRSNTKCKKCGTTIKVNKKISGLCYNCYYSEKILLLFKTEIKLLNINAFELFTKFYNTLINFRTPKATLRALVSQLDFFKYIDNKDNIINKFSYDYFIFLKEEYNLIISIELENFLIQENLLTPLTEMEQFIKLKDSSLSKVPVIFLEVYQMFVNNLIDRKHKLVSRGWYKKFQLSTYIKVLHCSCEFFNYLYNKIDSINEISNDLIDEYISKKQWDQKYLCYLINWLNKNVRLFKRLKLTKLKKKLWNNTPYSEEELFEIIGKLSTSNSFMHKSLGLLLILYGIRPVELVEIKTSDYFSCDNSSKLFIRNVWISLHPYVKEVLDNYIKIERSSMLSLGNKDEWLFYGYKFNTHLSKERVGEILRKYNINISRAFSTVVVNLLIDYNLVPSVIISGAGLNITTIMNYYKVLNIASTYNIEIDNNFKTIKPSIKTNKYVIYILKCIDGTYYTGYTSDLQKRLKQHQNGTGCTYTKTRTPVELVYTEELPDKPSALKREKQIKKLTIFDKEKLIEKSRVN